MTRVTNTYELSPMQAGMLFHTLSGRDPGVVIQQQVATLREPLDEARFLRAWQRVAERPPILRSRFRWKGSVAQHSDEYFGPDGCDYVSDMLLEPHVRAMAELFRRCRENSDMKVAPWTRG
jgi:hypothetical protein